jgi:hypothetical protein
LHEAMARATASESPYGLRREEACVLELVRAHDPSLALAPIRAA